ncbi:putative dimethylaniline monooxygenase [Aspergillus pseudoustus]|uniref:Dimethylaniline monooxygenase n=1 Tax=Aspergillus pseudoustus TaxID=1810923 RepID=A0ABR4IW33_9EURO
MNALAAQHRWPQEDRATGYRITESLAGSKRPMRIVHVGCGAAGICLAKFIPERMENVSFVCYDKNADVGGTWLENRYPGCACDIPSADYQFTWARNPDWSHFYSASPEIWRYFKDCVERFGLARYMKLEHRVEGAYWDGERGKWEVHVRDLREDTVFVDECDVFINGGGILNHWKWPEIEGLHSFKGLLCHTAAYPEGTDLTGKRVAVIGIGSSGVQVIATIANQVSKLYTWVRSPTWITAGFAQKYAGAGGQNVSYTPEQQKHWRANYGEYLQYCKEIETELNQRFKFILNGTEDAQKALAFSVEEMRGKLAGRQDLIESIIPKDFGIGCRRPTPGNGFLEALTLPHVHAFTKSGIARITQTGFATTDGEEHEVDVIICATGFDTSWVPRFPVVYDGKNAQDFMRERTLSYLAMAIPEVPNYFTIGGPYGPVGHGNTLMVNERLISNILKIVEKMQLEGIKSVRPKLRVAEKFEEHAQLFCKRTAWAGKCASWFKQGKKDGKLTIWPGSRLLFFEALKEPRYEDYNIEYLSNNPWAWLGCGFTLQEYDGSDIAYYIGTDEHPGSLLPEKEEDDGSRKTCAVPGNL